MKQGNAGPQDNLPMIGTTLQNRYRLDAELGTVYRAHDTLLDRDVAIRIRKAAFMAAAGGTYRNAPCETIS